VFLTSEYFEAWVKQTLETFREEDLRESEGVLGKAFERLKMAFLVIDMAAMVTRVCVLNFLFLRFGFTAFR
jgi:hypothetical protein